MKLQISILLLTFITLSSCKKNSTFSNPEVIIKQQGIIRVECNDCSIIYQVNDKSFTNSISNGSSDIPFFYASDFDLKTKVTSNEEQNIRVIIIDSYGRVVSNELNSKLKGEISVKNFAINTK